MTLNSKLFNLPYTGGTVGVEDTGEQLSQQIIEFTAVGRILVFLAVGTGQVFILLTADFYLAPFRLDIIMAARIPLLEVRPASPAVKTVIRH